MAQLIVAFCTYNRAERLPDLVDALRTQTCPIAFEILAVNNNSKDNTLAILKDLAVRPGVPLRFVTETAQGIVPARNRAIEECINADYMLFLDDDELPQPGWVAATYRALSEYDAECVGGRVVVNFSPMQRPRWLGDELLGFLAEANYGDNVFPITSTGTPVWTANVGYRMAIFRNNPSLRFDARYNRQGKIGGGEDAVMFRCMLQQGMRMYYVPDMMVEHFVEAWRLKRSYFLKLHYIAGRQAGYYEEIDYPRSFCGIAPFMLTQTLRHLARAGGMYLSLNPLALRQAMNASHALGQITGRFLRWKESVRSTTQPAKINVAFRFDDPAVDSDHTLEKAILGCFSRHRLPLTVAVVPFSRVQNTLVPVTADNMPHILQAHRSGDVEIAQHGYAHDHQSNGNPSEFGGLEETQQLLLMRAGLNQLRSVFGSTISGFVPPFNSMDAATMVVAHRLGFDYISAGRELPTGHGGLPLLLPRTCLVIHLQQAIEEARLRLAMSPTVIVVIHDYNFREFSRVKHATDKDAIAFTDMAKFDQLLAWLAAQPDVAVLPLREIAAGLSPDALIRSGHRHHTILHLHWRLQRMLPQYCLLTKPLWRYLRIHL